MPIEYRSWITRDMLQEEPGTLFVFGDNMLRCGLGGQAKEMRGEPNAVGFPTKIGPGTYEKDYFTNKDLETVKKIIQVDLERLIQHLSKGGTIVLPADGIGTGYAQLKERAPTIFMFYNAVFDVLAETEREYMGDINAG